MKKSLIALAALAATASFAQSTATISGSISVGILDTGAAGAKATVSKLGGGANAINIVTVEDLGGGLKGGFDSQIRFDPATGDRGSSGTGNALFHGANAYVSGGFGTARVGKIIEMSNCAYDPWGCTGGASLSAGLTGGISGLIAAGTIANAVSYATPTIAGFSATYQTSVSSRANARQVLSLNYANGPLTAQVLRSQNSANTAADPALAMTTTTPYTVDALSAAPITDTKGNGTSIAASYNFGMVTVSLFNSVTKNASDAKTADVTGLGLTVPVSATVSVLAGYAKDKKQAANADTKVAAGVNYSLSKRTILGADVFKDEKIGSTGYTLRVRHNF